MKDDSTETDVDSEHTVPDKFTYDDKSHKNNLTH